MRDTPDAQAAAIILVVSVCIALCLHWIGLRLFFNPLRRLAKAAKRMESGEPATLPRCGSGDLGQIAKTLAALSDDVATNRV